MAKPKKTASEPTLNYEAKLWQMADALRNNMDAAESRLWGSACISDSHLSETCRP